MTHGGGYGPRLDEITVKESPASTTNKIVVVPIEGVISGGPGNALVKAGVLRRAKDGVKLLGKGELKSKINITVYAATPSARAAVEKAGGALTTTKPEAATEA